MRARALHERGCARAPSPAGASSTIAAALVRSADAILRRQDIDDLTGEHLGQVVLSLFTDLGMRNALAARYRRVGARVRATVRASLARRPFADHHDRRPYRGMR